MFTLSRWEIQVRLAQEYLEAIVRIELMTCECKEKGEIMKIIMTDKQGNKSWATKQFHLELFPARFGRPRTLTLRYYAIKSVVHVCMCSCKHERSLCIFIIC